MKFSKLNSLKVATQCSRDWWMPSSQNIRTTSEILERNWWSTLLTLTMNSPTSTVCSTMTKVGRLSNIQTLFLEKTAVVVHGDMWTANFLWRGDSLAAIVDWQLTHPGGPVEDLLRVLSTCTTAGIRRKLTKSLINHYYNLLLSKNDGKLPFTREQLDVWRLIRSNYADCFRKRWELISLTDVYGQHSPLPSGRTAS